MDLDVNNDGDLNDPVDGISSYLPGYEGNTPKLHNGATFDTATYAGAQAMRIIIPKLQAHGATFKIIEVSTHAGYATNGTDANLEGNNEADFSFAAGVFEDEIEATVDASGIWAPIHCKDYGAWCKIEVALKKQDGTAMGDPFEITLPADANGDRIADVWQKEQINEWNEQYNLAEGNAHWADPEDTETWGVVFGAKTTLVKDAGDLTEVERNSIDVELADSDGAGSDGGPMPSMQSVGDGLTAIDEYRGFFLDGGPETTTPRHRRLSVARKELLVECSEMDGIATVNTSPIPNAPDFLDQGNRANAYAQLYLLSNTMSKVSKFFAKEGEASGASKEYFPGAGLDLWWVRDPLNDGITNLVYEDASVRSAYKYSGSYDYHPQAPENERNAWISLYSDHTIKDQSELLFKKYYGMTHINGAGIMANNGNRNPLCRHFIKLVLSGRKGSRNSSGVVNSRKGEACREMDEHLEPSYPTYQGSSVYVNSLSEEEDLDSLAEFDSRLAWGIGHELGHLFIQARGVQPFTAGENLDNEKSLMGVPQDNWNIQFHEAEIRHINLRQHQPRQWKNHTLVTCLPASVRANNFSQHLQHLP